MLHTKFREYRPAGSGEEDFRRVFISSPVQSTGRAIVLTLASAFAFTLAFPSRHF